MNYIHTLLTSVPFIQGGNGFLKRIGTFSTSRSLEAKNKSNPGSTDSLNSELFPEEFPKFLLVATTPKYWMES